MVARPRHRLCLVGLSILLLALFRRSRALLLLLLSAVQGRFGAQTGGRGVTVAGGAEIVLRHRPMAQQQVRAVGAQGAVVLAVVRGVAVDQVLRELEQVLGDDAAALVAARQQLVRDQRVQGRQLRVDAPLEFFGTAGLMVYLFTFSLFCYCGLRVGDDEIGFFFMRPDWERKKIQRGNGSASKNRNS